MMTTTDTLHVANTIREQIGNRALAMIGARDLVGDATSLRFRVGRNARGVTHLTVRLDPCDTYTVTAIKVGRNWNVTTIGEVADVYADSLRRVIESLTGMYTSL